MYQDVASYKQYKAYIMKACIHSSMRKAIRERETSKVSEAARNNENKNKGSMGGCLYPAPKASQLQFLDIIGSDLSRPGFCTGLRRWLRLGTVPGGTSTTQ